MEIPPGPVPAWHIRVNLRALSVVFVAVYFQNVGSATVPTLNGGHGGPPYDNLLLSCRLCAWRE
jgi:hypothetical protein